MGGFMVKDAPAAAEPERRVPIFEKANNDLTKEDLINMLRSELDNTFPPDARALIINSLGGFFFNDDEVEGGVRMELLLKAMTKESQKMNTYIMKEGEAGSKLYVIDSGEIEVTINGAVIRRMERGAVIGELALLYNAPRSATVRCVTDCTFWVLSRYMFKNIQAYAASNSTFQKSQWLMNCPELASLGSVEISRLMNTLKPKVFEPGDPLYLADTWTNNCILVEKGVAQIQLPKELQHLSVFELDQQLGIIRPSGERHKSISKMTAKELKKTIRKVGGAPLPAMLGDQESIANFGELDRKDSNEAVYEIHAGCLLGIAVLRTKAFESDHYLWRWEKVSDEKGFQAISPVTVVAVETLTCSMFTVEDFEEMFGSVNEVLPGLKGGSENILSQSFERDGIKDTPLHDYINIPNGEMRFDPNGFQTVKVLGKGSYGVVALAKYAETGAEYALKILSKCNIIETGQLRHVLDERKLLAKMSSIFILKLFGTYQTPDDLVFVTEKLDRGDLWSVIYETPHFKKSFPAPLIRFYTASIVLALAHIHQKKIAYRDLKPENIMIDSTGYIRIIDFGFAKKIPYTAVDADGNSKVYVKSYTLCGTPEYLAPEFIYNSGNDKAVDLWALGVMIHEMYLFKTPFTPKKPNDMTELFVNIASVKKVGLNLSSSIDSKDGSPHARMLISQLLKPEPTDRISVQEGSTMCILDHKYFTTVDIHSLESHTIVPMHIPDIHQPSNKIQDTSLKSQPYHGDQNIFSEF